VVRVPGAMTTAITFYDFNLKIQAEFTR